MSNNTLRAAAITATALLFCAPAATAQLAPYQQNFEGLDQMDVNALAADGWLVFGNVFDPTGVNYLYGYGTFGAPNAGGAFSNIADGQGGVDQGAQQLVIFNDYNNGDHEILNRIESNVFQERVLAAADVGETYVFSFDAKAGDLAGASTAIAFIKVLDPDSGFAVVRFPSIDTTSLPVTWNRYEISLTIDAELVGDFLQFGFASTATNFEPSGVLYDNIDFDVESTDTDTDGDGIGDSVDNCTNVSNADQRDTNGDGFGNICDADLNNDGVVNAVDLGLLRVAFFNTGAGLDADFNGDDVVNVADLGIMRVGFFMAPGPGAGN